MSQRSAILSHLKRGPITQLQAIKLYSCYRLAARIGELKDSGLDIRTQMVERDGKRFAKYWMAKTQKTRNEAG